LHPVTCVLIARISKGLAIHHCQILLVRDGPSNLESTKVQTAIEVQTDISVHCSGMVGVCLSKPGIDVPLVHCLLMSQLGTKQTTTEADAARDYNARRQDEAVMDVASSGSYLIGSTFSPRNYHHLRYIGRSHRTKPDERRNGMSRVQTPIFPSVE
jgi:hypothetical protein